MQQKWCFPPRMWPYKRILEAATNDLHYTVWYLSKLTYDADKELFYCNCMYNWSLNTTAGLISFHDNAMVWHFYHGNASANGSHLHNQKWVK